MREKKIFEEVMIDKFPSLMKNTNLKIQESQQTPRRTNTRKTS